MSLSTTYQNAFAEVDEILSHLVEEDYIKIPEDLLETFRECKNPEYEYEYDEDVELSEQKMLPETKAILFNLFRDYLSTPEQKEKIIHMQEEDRKKLREAKMAEVDHYIEASFTSSKEENRKEDTQTIEEKKQLPLKQPESGFLGKVMKMIRRWLK